jgi:tRNA (guanine37-N1)-methyltransferase
MKFTVITILPELIEPSLTAGVVGRAREAGIIQVDAINPRDFTKDKHRTVDDTPYGGGPGMVMKPEPLLAAIAKAMELTGSKPALREQDITAAALRELEADDDVDVLGQPTDPLAKVQRAIAKVESMLGGLEGAEGPLTSSQLDHGASSTVTEAEAAIAEVEDALRQSDIDTKPVAMIDDDRDLGLPAVNARRGALGPADGSDEMPNLVEQRNIVATPPVGVPIVAEPSSASPSSPSPSSASASSASASSPSPSSPSPSSPSPSSPSPSSPSPSSASPSSASPSSAEQTMAAGAAAKPAAPNSHRILLPPSGKPLTQARVRQLAALDHLVLVCGRYEGVDQRVIDLAIDEELSIGDYVLSGGELGALVIIDAVARLVPGVLGEPTSADDESFSAGLLEYPQYTRPPEITMPAALQSDRVASAVPPVLQSGNHAAINAWRRQQAMQRTAARRPDLWREFRPSKADEKLFPSLRARTHVALVHHPIVDRNGAIVTSALTNFDIHDLARSTMTYGLAGYHIVTPITSQREKAEHIAKLWMADEQGEHRAAALRLIRTAESVEAVIAALTEEHGQAPTVVATSARQESFPAAARRTSSELLAEASLSSAPLLLLLGTGWGLADQLIPSVSRVLAPIEGASPWNHLSVRSAGAVILDRLFGRPA